MSASRVESFFFRPASPVPLGLCRILFFGWLFLWYLQFDFTAIAFYPQELWRPMQLLRWAQLNFIPSESVLAVVQVAWKASLLLACVGLFARAAAGLSCVLGAYLLALTHSFYKINHSDGLLVMAMLVLAFARSSDALSLDRVIWKRTAADAPRPSGEYHWPFQAIRLAFVCLFFGSGLSKLILGGLDWMFTNNLYNIVVYCQLTRDPLLDLNIHWPVFYKVLAVGTVVIELLAPLALFHAGWRAFIVLSLLGMQVGIRLTMGDNFTQFMSIYLFWVPWMALSALLAKRTAAGAGRADVLSPDTFAHGTARKA